MSKSQKKSLEDKVKEAHPEFYEEVQTLPLDSMDNRLAQLMKDSLNVDQAKEDDEDLEKAQEQASLMGAPYREAKAMIKLKSRYLVKLIKDRGGKT